MKKFISFHKLRTIQSIPEFSDLATLCLQDDSCGSPNNYTKNNPFSLYSYTKNAVCDYYHINANCTDLHVTPSKILEKYFYESDLANLSDTHNFLYANHTLQHIPRKHLLFNDLKVLGEHYLSIKSQSQRSVAIMAYWGSPATDTNLCPLKVGLVENFFIH